MESFATPYPVIFFDGELEHDKGLVGIHSVLTYKRFQSLLSQKTGVPANQLSAVFVCRRTQKDTDKRQRLPINGNTNFSILLNQHNPSKERDCYFFVSVKKSKKERKGSRKRGAETDNPDDCADPSLDERGQVSITVDEMASQEARSPHRQTTTVPTAVSNRFSGITAQRSYADGSNLQSGSDKKVGRILLKRQVVGPNVARRGWNSGSVQGSDVLFVQGNDQTQNLHIMQGGDHQTRPGMYWREENFSRETDCEHSRLRAQFFLPPSPMDPSYPFYEVFNPERLRDSLGPSLTPSTLNLQRNAASPTGIFSLNFSRPSSLTPMSSPIFSAGLQQASRIPPSSSGMAAFTVREPDFRRTNAQLFQMQAFSDTYQGAFGGYTGVQGDIHAATGRDHLCCHVCFDCKERNIFPIPFHWCVQDEVTIGFRGPSPAGPIERPAKANHVEAAAA